MLLSLLAASSGTLLDQRVVVTGGGRGIGRAIALLCAQEGAQVALLARTASEMEAVAAEAEALGAVVPVLVRPCDVTDEAAVDATIASLATELGGIDVLVNNAGGSCNKAVLWEQSGAELRDLLELNVISILTVSSAVLRHAMLPRSKGRIINISSRAGKVGIASMGPYCTSKFAVEGLTAALAADLARAAPGVCVNSLSPGMVDTRSFPKSPGRPGVRTAASIRDGFLHLLACDRTGHYLHVDEFDAAVAAGQPNAALKPIDEPNFEAPAEAADVDTFAWAR